MKTKNAGEKSKYLCRSGIVIYIQYVSGNVRKFHRKFSYPSCNRAFEAASELQGKSRIILKRNSEKHI